MRRTEYDHAINKYRHRFLDERIKDLAISRADAPFLHKIVKAGNQIKMNDLIELTFYHKSHATRSINRMVEDGLIIKETNPEDLRGYVLSATGKGKEVDKQLKQIFEDWDNLVNQVITDEEREILSDITKRIYHQLKKYYHEEDIDSEVNI
ncbi:MarR family transcriptional regulator [Mycoplasmatota bacterium WC30]